MLKLAIIADLTHFKSFFSFFKENKNKIEKKITQEIKITYVCSKSVNKEYKSFLKNKSIEFKKDYNQILLNSEIDVIIDLKKNEESLNYILQALKNNKLVITTNQKVMAENYSKIKKLEKENNTKIYFSAAFSPLPVQTLIDNFYVLDELKELNAIFNATTNYILTQMEKNTVSMKETIEQAKKLSYTEENTELDLDGLDSLYKIILSANLLFDTALDLEKIQVKGIKGITSYDLIYAGELGFKIKLITTIKKIDDNLYIGVRPNLISENSYLASVNENSNAVEVVSEFNSKTTLKAENTELTDENLLSIDLIKAAKSINRSDKSTSNYQKQNYNLFDIYSTQKNSFYIRLQIEKNDKTIDNIKDIFSEENLADLILHDNLTETPLLPVIIITKKIKEEDLEKNLQKVEDLEGVLTVNNIIPVQAE